MLRDDTVVMTKIAEMAACFDGSFGKEIIEVECHCADDDRMLGHQLDKLRVISNIESSRVHSRRINGDRSLPRPPIVDIRECHDEMRRRVDDVERDGLSHQAGAKRLPGITVIPFPM